MSDDQTVNIVKGMRIRAQFLQATMASLAGNQPKFGAKARDVTGVVKGVYGDHPTAPTQFEIEIEQDDGTLVRVKPQHIVTLNVGGPNEKHVQVHSMKPIPEEPLG